MRNVTIGAAFVLLIALYAQLCAAQQAPGARFPSAEDAGRGPHQAVRLLVNVGNDSREVPFYGYYFRRLDPQKVIAYPAQYRVTGVKTFVAGADNVVFEKNLGPRTAEVARTMERLDSPSTWQRIE